MLEKPFLERLPWVPAFAGTTLRLVQPALRRLVCGSTANDR